MNAHLIPCLTDLVEKQLTSYYLTGPDCELRFIDASPRELTEILGVDEQLVTQHLVSACGGPKRIISVLAGRENRFNTDGNVPGFFRFLVLSCHIACMIDTKSINKNFRTNFASIIKSPYPITNLSGLPALWQELKKWCANRPACKRLIIPTGNLYHTHIGSTQAISFPIWRDKGPLSRLLYCHDRSKKLNGETIELEKYLVRRSTQLNSDEFSEAFRAAWSEFYGLYIKADTRRRSHRFWKMLESFDVAATTSVSRYVLRLRNIDFQWQMSFENDLDPKSTTLLVGSIDDVLDSLKARVMITDPNSLILKLLMACDLAIFIPEGFGTYTADVSKNVKTGGAIVGKNSLLANIKAAWRSDSWSLWIFNDAEQFNDILVSLKELVPTYNTLIEQAIMPLWQLTGGIIHGSEILNYKELLPVIASLEPGIMVIEQNGREQRKPVIPGDHWHLADASLGNGEVLISLHGEAQPSRRRFFLVSPSPEHPYLAKLNDADWDNVHELGYNRQGIVAPQHQKTYRPKSVSQATALNPLLEALYFKGQNGWPECHLIPFLRGVVISSSPWAILRTLEESGWLEVRQSCGWGVRKWFLKPPELIKLPDGLLLAGASPEIIRKRFVSVVEKLGGDVQIHHGLGSFSPTLMRAQCIDANQVAKELTWPLKNIKPLLLEPAPKCWSTDVRSLRYGGYVENITESWNWKLGRFVGGNHESRFNGVTLRAHQPLRRHLRKLYSISLQPNAEPLVFSSRVSAILEAHRMASHPLFHFDGWRLHRTGADGYLPLVIARLMVTGFITSPGSCESKGQPSGYAYPCSESWAVWLTKIFGRTVISASNDLEATCHDNSKSMHDNTLARHRAEGRYVYFQNQQLIFK